MRPEASMSLSSQQLCFGQQGVSKSQNTRLIKEELIISDTMTII